MIPPKAALRGGSVSCAKSSQFPVGYYTDPALSVLDGHAQLPKLILGVKFTDGLEVAAKSISQPATAAA
jgi:hypothetical protein